MANVFDLVAVAIDTLLAIPTPLLILWFASLLALDFAAVYLVLCFIAPNPRLPFPSEKTYQTTTPDGHTVSRQLPCWYDKWLAERHLAAEAAVPAAASSIVDAGDDTDIDVDPTTYDLNVIEPAEVGLTVVVPAYNEALRILPALEEMVEYCDKRFGRPKLSTQNGNSNGKGGKDEATTEQIGTTVSGGDGRRRRQRRRRRPVTPLQPKSAAAGEITTLYEKVTDRHINGDEEGDEDDGEEDGRDGGLLLLPAAASPLLPGYEILIVSDASTDDTVAVALDFARRRGLHDVLRVVSLAKNRGKGGGVTHGLRHARGAYVVFADADGASRFGDLDKLLEGCDVVVDASGRGVAIGSRAHLVGSEAVVQRSALRNFLMKSFHFVLTILTPPATSRIRDTQCGFKLFSRATLPHIVPYMHTEGWIFDIEMLMLAESAPASPVVAHDGTIIGTSAGIRVAEVPVAWHEVDGSKMSLVQDSIRMAIGLTVLRASWMLGVYRRRWA